jgi:hypothetical protein
MRGFRSVAVLPGPALAVLIAVLGGCDGAPSVDSSKTEATVTGHVSVKGKPAKGGEIIFDPSNVDRPVGPRSAPIGADGSYTITTFTGGNLVKFGGKLVSENPGLFRFKKYQEFQRGANTADFDLLADAEPASPTIPANPKAPTMPPGGKPR